MDSRLEVVAAEAVERRLAVMRVELDPQGRGIGSKIGRELEQPHGVAAEAGERRGSRAVLLTRNEEEVQVGANQARFGERVDISLAQFWPRACVRYCHMSESLIAQRCSLCLSRRGEVVRLQRRLLCPTGVRPGRRSCIG